MTVVFSHRLKTGRFEIWSSKPPMDFHQVTQVHGSEIVSLQTLPCEADGMMVSWEDLSWPLAIKTADCLPVVIQGEKGVICAHAGWRGLAGKILQRPEVALIKPTSAFVGPFIQSCCFEVSKDFIENFPNSTLISRENRAFFDLGEESRRQLRILNPQMEIEITEVCTCCDKSLHSHRRDKTKNRNWNLYLKG